MSTAEHQCSFSTEEPSPLALVLLALLGLLVFDALRLGRKFPKTCRLVRRWKTNSRYPAVDVVDRVCRAVNYASAFYPKQVRCLQRSTVTVCLLRSCGVAAEMIVGAQILPFKAHAWTEVGRQAVNERNAVQKIYSVLERC
jgi:hypothetical protein